MNIRVGDSVIMKKSHPCGSARFVVLRTGLDLKLKCCGCDHIIEGERCKLERKIKSVEKIQENV